MHSVSIVGCGYTGLRLAGRWLSLTHGVRGFASRAESLRQIAAIGAESIALNLDQTPAMIDLDGQVAYYAVPPAPVGDRDFRLERLLAHIVGTPRRFVYLSTTGVDGDPCRGSAHQGTPPPPP